MSQILFQQEADINIDWLFYIENEAASLAQRDEAAIRNYQDREMFNPEMQSYLASASVASLLGGTRADEPLELNSKEKARARFLPDWLKPRFRKLKAKVKDVFCDAVRRAGETDTKSVIKAGLLALIPAFASGLPAAVLPIVIGLAAFLLRYGIDRACPL